MMSGHVFLMSGTLFGVSMSVVAGGPCMLSPIINGMALEYWKPLGVEL